LSPRLGHIRLGRGDAFESTGRELQGFVEGLYGVALRSRCSASALRSSK